MPQLARDDYYDIADNLAQASAAILSLRVNSQDLSPAQADALEKIEDELDHRVVMFRNYGISVTAGDAATAKQTIQTAIDKAKTTVAKINSIKKAITIGTALVDLGVSIAAGNFGGIVAGAKEVQDAIDPPPQDNSEG